MSRNALRRSLAALLAVAAPAAAQQASEPGAPAFRTGMGVVLLLPLQAPASVPTLEGRLPSGRMTLTHQVGGVFGLHAGGMRLAADGTGLVSGIWAGVGGFRLNLLRGGFRFAPFVEASVGRAQAALDVGGYEYEDPSGVRGYRPVWERFEGLVYGGGGGATTELILGPGLTFEATAGYWHFLPPEGLDDPLGGAFAGAGIRWSFRDEAWYWRTSGGDEDLPAIAVLAPERDSAGIYAVGVDTATLAVVVSDRSDVGALEVDGRGVPTSPVPDTMRERLALQLPARIARIPLRLAPGADTIRVAARDGAGNAAARELVFLGAPVDSAPPRIAVLEPARDAEVADDSVVVTGLLADRSAVTEVVVNGAPAAVRPAESPEERGAAAAGGNERAFGFEASAALTVGENTIEVIASDSFGNVARLRHRVYRRAPVIAGAGAGPEIEIIQPREWSAGARGIEVRPKRSIAIEGVVRYARGVAEVRIDGARASLALDPSGINAHFAGYAPVAPGTDAVDILARGLDGRTTLRSFTVRPNPAADPGSAGLGEFTGRRWAVVIGISEYVDPTIPDLEYADDDARAVYEFLRSQAAGLGGIPESEMRLLLNEEATMRNIRSALFTFLKQSTDDDVLLVYIAGHGMPDPERLSNLYLLAHDTELADLAATAIAMDDVNGAINEAYARNKVLIADACHSAGVGAAGGRAVNLNLTNQAFLDAIRSSSGGFVAFTAAEAAQLSQEGEQWGGGHGVFTHYLLEGLRGGADADGDRIVTLGEVMEFTRDRVRRETANAQIPAISPTSYDRYWPMAIDTRR